MAEQFVLRWHYHEHTLLTQLPRMLDCEMLTDITLSVGCETIRAHRLVLATCSSYFFDLFQKIDPVQHPVIILHDVDLQDLKAVLSFMYRGQCLVSKDQLPGLISIAKLLKIQGLCDIKVPFFNRSNGGESNTSSIDIGRNLQESNRLTENVEEYSHRVKSPPKQNLPIPLLHSILSNSTSTTVDKKSPSEETIFKTNEPGSSKSDNDNKMTQKKLPRESSETCKCFLCGKYLSNQYNLRVHMETHEEAYHACQSCPHVSRSRDALRKHISYRHPEEYHSRKRRKTEENAPHDANT